MRIVAGILALLWAGALHAATITGTGGGVSGNDPPACYSEDSVYSFPVWQSGFVYGESIYAGPGPIISDPEYRLPEQQFVRANCRRFDAVSVWFDTSFFSLVDAEDGTPFTPKGLTTFFYGLREGSLVAAVAARPGAVTFGKDFKNIDRLYVSVILPQSIRWTEIGEDPIFDGRYREDLVCLREFCSVLAIEEITLAPIPVPASLPLVLAAIVPLVGLRIRRRVRTT